MESFVLFDSTRGNRTVMELAAYPVLPGASKDSHFEDLVHNPRNLRGKWESLVRCGHVFQHAESIKYMICDGHGSHLWIRQLLMGEKITLHADLLSSVPFFKDLVCEDLPTTCIPFPWRIVRIQGESIHYIPGPGTHHNKHSDGLQWNEVGFRNPFLCLSLMGYSFRPWWQDRLSLMCMGPWPGV